MADGGETGWLEGNTRGEPRQRGEGEREPLTVGPLEMVTGKMDACC